ncbi:MAG: tetratricopeptide repeat protein [Candidatus Latescibacterota bacterium]
MMAATRLLHPALVAACAVLLYANSLDGGFHYDDFHSLVDNPHVRRLANLPSFLVDPSLFSVDPDKAMYRPLLLASYALNHALAPGSGRAYHGVNVALHAGCAVLVWGIGRRAGLGAAGALAAGLLFAAHPLASEPVNYVSSRSESQAALFFLAAFLLLMEPGGRRRWAGVACFVAGLLTKSVVIVLPAVVLLHERWAAGTAPRRTCSGAAEPRRAVPQLSLWIAAAAYVAVIAANRFLTRSLAAAPRNLSAQVWTQLEGGVYYLKLLGMPVGLNVEHQFFAADGPLVPAVAASGLLLVSLGVLAVRRLPSRWRVWPAWACLTLLPSTLVPLNVLVNEHRLYLPLAGLCLLVGQAWGRTAPPVRARLGGAVLLAVCGALAVQRNRAWSDEASLWSAAVARSPRMPRAHVHLGNALQQQGRWEEARQAYERALALDPGHSAGRTNLGNLYLEAAGRDPARAAALRQRAAREYEQVLAADPDHPEALNGLGSCYLYQDETERAEAAFARLVQRHPGFAPGWLNLGMAAARRGDAASAARHLRQSLQLREDGEARCELGSALVRLGDLEGAAREYEAGHRQRPTDLGCTYNLAEVLLVLGERRRAAGQTQTARAAWERARALLGAVVRQDPQLGQAQAHLRELEGRL